MAATWIDLLDPTEEELRTNAPRELQAPALELMLRHSRHDDEPRPTLQSHGDYIFGVFLLARAIPEENAIYYQEIDVVITADTILTVRKTPADDREPYDVAPLREAVHDSDGPGMIAYRLIDHIAEAYLDVVDDIDAEIDELEDKIEDQSPTATRQRISALRHDLLHVRRTLAPMRDAVRGVVDDVVEVKKGTEVFPHEVEIALSSAYDKLLRALDGLEFSRDLLASVRDYQQSKIANDQNEVTKRLTVIASIILFPTFIVGLYGQNFVHMPELKWHYGYAYSWALIVFTTIAQLWWFRRKHWI
jgi:magnesium transporter